MSSLAFKSKAEIKRALGIFLDSQCYGDASKDSYTSDTQHVSQSKSEVNTNIV